MKHPLARSVIHGVLVLLGWAGLLAGCGKKSPPAPLTHEVYVWQRSWNGNVRQAVEQARESSLGFVPLAAQIAWRDGRPAVTWPEVDWKLVGNGHRLTLAVRVDPLKTKDLGGEEARQAVVDTTREVLRRARDGGASPAEIQIDFDAAESQLAGYAEWVEAVRQTVAPLPVTFTALPCWLKRAEFPALARAGHGYVLQVHAAEKPTVLTKDLCNPAQARIWVLEAARAAPGVPFRVALPTYTYELAFAPDDSCLGIVAEGESRAWPEGSRVVFLRADPAALAALRDGWNRQRPAEMTGLVWYRLPVSQDLRNWRWTTLRALVEGRTPAPRLETRAQPDTEGKLHDLVIANTGDADARLPAQITVAWDADATPVAGDALSGYEWSAQGQMAEFRLPDAASSAPRVVPPGESAPLGWLRFSTPVSDLQIEIFLK